MKDKGNGSISPEVSGHVWQVEQHILYLCQQQVLGPSDNTDVFKNMSSWVNRHFFCALSSVYFKGFSAFELG